LIDALQRIVTAKTEAQVTLAATYLRSDRLLSDVGLPAAKTAAMGKQDDNPRKHFDRPSRSHPFDRSPDFRLAVCFPSDQYSLSGLVKWVA
jgi:hypothetical protein